MLTSAQARQLLKEASDGVNPFEGFTPKLADGESLVFGTEEFDTMEAEGLKAAAKTGFVLVSLDGKARKRGLNCQVRMIRRPAGRADCVLTVRRTTASVSLARFFA